MHILMIEDDKNLCETIALHLRENGFEVQCCHDGQEGLLYAMEDCYDLVLLDRMLPGMDGQEVLARLRAGERSVPVLMVTALSEIHDRIDGLDAGADDYITKPFAVEELLARVRALLRRPRQMDCFEELSFGDLALDVDRKRLSGPGGSTELSQKEASLLEVFFRNPSQILPRRVLFSRVWGSSSDAEESNLDTYIHFVRRRLKSVSGRVSIATMRSVGYRIVDVEGE